MAANVPPGGLDELELLAGLTHAIAESHDLEQGLATALGSLVERLGASAGAVYLLDPDRVELHLVTAIGLSSDDMAAMAVTDLAGADPAAGAARDGREVTIDSSRRNAGGAADESHGGDLAARAGLASTRYLPLQVGRDGIEATVGVLAIGWAGTHDPSGPESLAVSAAADLLAVAIDRGRLAASIAERAEWLERLAHTDPLTGLANRRTLDRVLELEVARASRQSSEVSVAIFNVDRLAEVNRESGYTVGDDTLRAVASVLADSVRLVDTVARYGGDDFIVVAPGAGGRAVAQRVIDGLNQYPSVGGRAVSVSAGIARFPGDGTSAGEILDAAEAALGRARIEGAGQIAGPSEVVEPA